MSTRMDEVSSPRVKHKRTWWFLSGLLLHVVQNGQNFKQSAEK
jgi:hypothetical protein